MISHQIVSPPPDIELGFPRQPLKYVTVAPAAGIGPDTGVMLFLCPWGLAIEDPYVGEKLLPHLANTHDCVAVAANYFGIGVKRRSGKLAEFDGWRPELARRFGAQLLGLPFEAVFAELVRLGVSELPPDLPLLLLNFPEYPSFGLQPALDNIAVLADVLRQHTVRHDRIYAVGSSYGGYIACLMLKLMPNTFHAVVENSGFTHALPEEMATTEGSGRHWFEGKGGIRLCCMPASPWTTRDPRSKYFVSPSVLAIRDCVDASQYTASKTYLASYHAEKDDLIPLEAKRRFWAAIGSKLKLRSVPVDDTMIDGRLFKSNAHGMDASLQLLSDDGLRGLPPCSADAETDFSRNTRVDVAVPGCVYRASYRPDLSVAFSLHATVGHH